MLPTLCSEYRGMEFRTRPSSTSVGKEEDPQVRLHGQVLSGPLHNGSLFTGYTVLGPWLSSLDSEAVSTFQLRAFGHPSLAGDLDVSDSRIVELEIRVALNSRNASSNFPSCEYWKMKRAA